MLTNEGNIDKFLGIEITQLDAKRSKVTQLFSTDQTISCLGVDTNNFGMETNPKQTPIGKPLPNKDLTETPQKEDWNYCTAVGMLTYLQANIHPEMSMAVHQPARFCNQPMLTHEKAIKRLGRYLYHTKSEGIVYNPDTSKGLE